MGHPIKPNSTDFYKFIQKERINSLLLHQLDTLWQLILLEAVLTRPLLQGVPSLDLIITLRLTIHFLPICFISSKEIEFDCAIDFRLEQS